MRLMGCPVRDDDAARDKGGFDAGFVFVCIEIELGAQDFDILVAAGNDKGVRFVWSYVEPRFAAELNAAVIPGEGGRIAQAAGCVQDHFGTIRQCYGILSAARGGDAVVQGSPGVCSGSGSIRSSS